MVSPRRNSLQWGFSMPCWRLLICLYLWKIQTSCIFYQISERIDKILIESFSVSFHISADFIIHHKEWVLHAIKTDEGRYCRNFPVAYAHRRTDPCLGHNGKSVRHPWLLFLITLKICLGKFYTTWQVRAFSCQCPDWYLTKRIAWFAVP